MQTKTGRNLSLNPFSSTEPLKKAQKTIKKDSSVSEIQRTLSETEIDRPSSETNISKQGSRFNIFGNIFKKS